MNFWLLKNRRLMGAVAVAGMAAAAVALYFFNPLGTWWMPRCPWLALTGWQCPSCGVMRATHQLLHGHWAEALALNLWLPLSVPLAIGIIGLSLRAKLSEVQERALQWLLILYIASYFIWWVARNLLGI